MFKTETHLHTAPVSSCASIPPREMIRRYKEAGYDTVFVSDHLAKFHFDKFPEGMTWEQQVDYFFAAYDKAKKSGDEFGINVLLSAELSLHGNHYLLYGINREMIYARPDIFQISLEEFAEFAKKNRLTVVQAHPLRDGKCTPHPECVDGMEAVNANPRHENFDDEVFKIAKAHNLPVSAGSDAHRDEDIGNAAMISDVEITSVEQYVDLFLNGKLKLMRRGEIL